MKYDKIVEAIFIERPNRFIARVKINGAEEVELVHVKNTGRCRELLLPGAEVILEDCIEKNQNFAVQIVNFSLLFLDCLLQS